MAKRPMSLSIQIRKKKGKALPSCAALLHAGFMVSSAVEHPTVPHKERNQNPMQESAQQTRNEAKAGPEPQTSPHEPQNAAPGKADMDLNTEKHYGQRKVPQLQQQGHHESW